MQLVIHVLKAHVSDSSQIRHRNLAAS